MQSVVTKNRTTTIRIIILVHIQTKIKPTVKVMIGSVSRILQVRDEYPILLMMTGYQRQSLSLVSECYLESTKADKWES